MDFREDQTWVGAGGKVGGIAIFGAESFEGVAVRVDSVDNSWHEVNVTSVRLGLGLGDRSGSPCSSGSTCHCWSRRTVSP
ncbi:hypothetical protein GA0074692_2001 [Micromonospora pallida]|uniref:Uncharacterized protein n=1 Tax=Micromonospora pallida TaxID=145854 RepID=A0A1C6S843_9ACTN|nr:hypothetical protein GA0074692_2001 [Micromonospora pallida]